MKTLQMSEDHLKSCISVLNRELKNLNEQRIQIEVEHDKIVGQIEELSEAKRKLIIALNSDTKKRGVPKMEKPPEPPEARIIQEGKEPPKKKGRPKKNGLDKLKAKIDYVLKYYSRYVTPQTVLTAVQNTDLEESEYGEVPIASVIKVLKDGVAKKDYDKKEISGTDYYVLNSIFGNG